MTHRITDKLFHLHYKCKWEKCPFSSFLQRHQRSRVRSGTDRDSVSCSWTLAVPHLSQSISRGKLTAFKTSNRVLLLFPIKASLTSVMFWSRHRARWHPTLESNSLISSQEIFKWDCGLAKGLEPGSMGIFRTFDSFPKTTTAPAKSESYELHPVVIQHKLTQQITKPTEQNGGP